MYFKNILAGICLVGAANALAIRQTAPPPECGNRGLGWAKYPNTNSDGTTNNTNTATGYPSFDPTIVKSRTPSITGTATSVGGFNTVTNANAVIYGTTERAGSEYYILNHHFYIYAPESGMYTIDFGTNNIDDIVCVWARTGAAIRGWTKSNASKCLAISQAGTTTYSFDLTAGRYWPVRIIYAQAQGGAIFSPKITSPSGQTIIDGSRASNYVVQKDCAGSIPAWPAWGSET